jgi:ABC-type transport system substrate-binding protein
MRFNTRYRGVAAAIIFSMVLVLVLACGDSDPEIVVQTVIVTEQVAGETIVETVIVKEQVPGEKVVETVIVKEQVPGEKVIQTVIVEKQVAGQTVVETVIVETEKLITVVATPTPLPISKAPSPRSKIGSLTFVGGGGTVGKKAGTNGTQAGLWRKGVTEGPFMLDVPKTVRGMVVDTWSVSSDTTKITLNIRTGIQFHKGWGELTAEDFAWNIDDTNSAVNLDSIHAAAGDIAAMLGANPVVVVDADTVELTVQQFDVRWAANQFNVAAQTPQMFSKTACETNGAEWCRDNIIGTGPFEVVEWRDDDRLVLSAVENHWRKTPEFSQFIFLEVPEDATRKAMMLTGEADLADVSIKTQSELREDGLRVAWTKGGRGIAIQFGGNYWDTENRLDKTPLTPWTTPPYEIDRPWTGAPSEWDSDLVYTDTNNPAGMDDMEQARLVRHALNMAIDRDLINEALFAGLVTPFYMGMYLPTQSRWQDKWNFSYDPARAEELLDQAGFPRGSDGIRFEAPLTANSSDSKPFAVIADAVGGFWEEIGVRVSVNKIAYALFRPSLVDRTASDIFIAGCRHNNLLPWDWPRGLENTSFTRGGFNCYKENPEIANTFALVNAESDLQKRIELNDALAVYSAHWMLEGGTILNPSNIVYNPRSVESWDMPDTISPGFQMPELIVPASR